MTTKNAVFELPFAKVYKYLGIQFTGRLDFTEHEKLLRQKIGFIAYSFTPLRRRGDDLKFDLNMWQVMVRPLLDYCASYSSYDKTRKNIALWIRAMRFGVRKMLGWTKGFRIKLIDLITQYDYYQVPRNARALYQAKWDDYLQNGKITRDYASIYTYQKFSAGLLPKSFTETGNVFFSSIICYHHSHPKSYKEKLTISHLEHHYQDLPLQIRGANVEQILMKAIEMAIDISRRLSMIRCVQEKRKLREQNGESGINSNKWEAEERLLQECSLSLARSREHLDEECSKLEKIVMYINRLRIIE